jgi:hypothetical protein
MRDMIRDLVIFNGASNLDFQDIRTNVIRIPEVVTRLREAQEVWDKISPVSLDLTNFVASEDSVFLGNIRLKNFASAIVQLGLLDRYLKQNRVGEFMLGAVNGDSPLRVALGEISFREMIEESPALLGYSARASVTSISGGELPVLAGMQLMEYGVYRRGVDGSFKALTMDLREIDKLIVFLVEEYDVRKIVMVGPGSALPGRKTLDLSDRDVQILESIDLDPMLSWFWSNLRDSRSAVS